MTSVPKFILIGGSPRSGTSLVQKLLISHSRIDGGPEFVYMPKMSILFDQMKKSIIRDSISMYVNEEKLIENFQKFTKSFFESSITDNTYYISEKTPSNIFAFLSFNEYLPSAKLLNVYRDGRAVVASFRNVRKRALKNGQYLENISLIASIKTWNNSIDAYFEYVEEVGNNLYSVKYEDLVTNPRLVLLELMHWLDLELEDQMLSPELINFNDNKKDAKINDIWYTKGMYNQSFNTSNIDTWKKELNFFEKIISNILMADRLDRLEYPVKGIYLTLNRVLKLCTWKYHKTYLKKSSLVINMYKKFLLKIKM
ncbi:sulfotransferase family protein [Fulvivirga sediminis]|uniref:Sulfotransferase n=1 Tax=Fulvivirga sediminis TaxID=2803949 RepID=A0A937JXD8_9BACT|nr:sulfotransferase [Fulvivirga sediminis]MBL3655388.1 sulfotransferase [Fulvivirga sediminis]